MPETYKYPFISRSSAYSTEAYPFINGGVVARYVSDKLPQGKYINLQNAESRLENGISSCMGSTPITPNGGLAGSVVSLGRLKGLTSTWRYAKGDNGHIYRRQGDTQGAFTDLDSGYATGFSRCSFCTYRPNLSSVPYIFITDGSKMAKDNGTTLSNMGISPPTQPPTASLGGASFNVALDCESDAVFTYISGFLGHAAVAQVNTTIAAAIVATGVQTVTPASMTNIIVGSLLIIDAGNPNQEDIVVTSISGSSFTANFTKTHGAAVTVGDKAITANDSSGSASANGLALDLRDPGGSGNAYGRDIFSLLILVGDVTKFQNLSLTLIDGNGKTANVGFYNYDTGIPDLHNSYFTGIANNAWYQTTWPRSYWQTSGTFDWSNVTSVNITMGASAAIALGFNDMLVLGGGPDVTGGIPYDYRITYYNGNTGLDSNPSVEWITNSYVSPVNQPVTVSWVASGDTQVTSVNVWRRGGTLANAWYRVGRVAIGTTTFVDTVPDSVAVEADQLQIDNDAPVTSTLQSPVNTTLGTAITAGLKTVTPGSLTNIYANQELRIGTGATAETVYVQSVNSGLGQFTAYFQYAHGSTETVYGTTRPQRPMNLAAIAYERMWLAGDPDNPHILYYSKATSPETFPASNTLEIGTPSDPIMALVVLRGQLFVFTLTRIWTVSIIGKNPAFALPTTVKHGLVGSWAWCIGDGAIYYMSFDGPRVFNGATSEYMGQDTQSVWIRDLNAYSSPIPTMDPAALANSTLAFYHNEVYVGYSNNGSIGFQQMIWHTEYKRWRNGNHNSWTILTEEDNDALVFSSYNYIYQDRVGNVNYSGADGSNQGVAFNVLTPYLDQGLPKNQKNYVELWLDIDTAAQNVTVALQFDNGAQAPQSFTVNASGRTRVCLTVNGGIGVTAYNIALQISGTNSATAGFVTVYAASIRHIVTPERRTSLDTWFQDDGTPAYKVLAELWAMYESYDAGGINGSLYIDGSTTAAFTFNLPQANTRAEVRIQCPAIKYKIRRLVLTSASDFKMYGDSFMKWKPVDLSEGWQRAELKEPITD